MGTAATSDTPGPTLAGIVLSDRSLATSRAGQPDRQSAGSARWPFGAEGPAHTQLTVFFQAARTLGALVPDGLLFQAGQIFYQDGQVIEVRLSGLLPGTPEATGQPTFMPWSTSTPPALTAGPDGMPVLALADSTRAHFSALVVPERAGTPQLIVACVWDLREPAGPLSLVPTPLVHKDHLIVLNPAHYQAIRESLAHNTFTTVEGVPWPAASLDTGPARGQVQLRPVVVEAQPWMSPEETDRWAQRMWEQRKELSDLDADALDALCALWLTQAQRVDEDVVGDIDALLTMRGLQPKRNGGGQAGGYRPEQRAAMWRAVLHVQNLWVYLTTVEVYQYLGIRSRRRRSQLAEETVQSRVFAITDRLGHLRPDGFFDVEKFIFRPGKVFAHFLFGTGRQTALLAAQALRYDPLRQTWEKRLARYLSYQWRCKAYAGDLLQPFKVASLLEAVGTLVNSRKPFLTRARLEKALDTLLQDRLIAAWQYDRWDEACTARRGWARVWLQATILIEPPESVRLHYQRLARHEEPTPLALPAPLTLGVRVRQRRQQLRLTLTQVAEQLGVSPSYLYRLEQGHRGKRPAAKLQQTCEKWLAASLSQDEGAPT
jgi:hypothetical protein